MSQYHFTPEHYLELMRAEVPAFDEIQRQVAVAAAGLAVSRILELGTGTGETARRVLEAYPGATLTGIDVSEEMLARARQVLPAERIETLLVRGIQDALPEGPFDLVVSALSVHHLDDPAKAELFRRVAAVVRPGGRFVLGDVVVPDDPQDAVTPLTPGYDLPSATADLLVWLRDAGFDARLGWSFKDVAVLRADRH
jgi:tRNA (cmo5U34)-methyltransferase